MNPQAFGTHDIAREGRKLAIKRAVDRLDDPTTPAVADVTGIFKKSVVDLAKELEAAGEFEVEAPAGPNDPYRYALTDDHGPLDEDEATARRLIERASRASDRTPTLATDGGQT